MTEYHAPLKEMTFLLEDVIGFEGIEGADALDSETIEAILSEAGKLASDILAPLNHHGDQNPPVWKDNCVTTPKGWKDAYQAYCEGGWNSVPFDPEYEGQGLPWLLSFPIQEMWQSANMSFGLCPLLNQGAIEAIDAHGSDEQKAKFLPKMISGEWTGTMNLTEPQAGSNLAAIRSKAVPQNDGSYKISGQKIFITYGEHDLTDNIVHLVLARTPDAPQGVKGISLFIVPKFILNAEGNPSDRNDVQCVSIEHKLGIHASPTCTMIFGDDGGATGYLVGEENQGLKYMFTMMNNARLSVGLQGVAIAERAYQDALTYSHERTQGRNLKTGKEAPIHHHADIQYMLLDMKSKILAGRALTYEAARLLDLSNQGDTAAKGRVELLTPIVKAWCTDMAVEVASTGIQVFGGMGFVEETGAAQHYRDARILPIYEGTNGIQAADLVFRKVLMDNGDTLSSWVDEKIKSLESTKVIDSLAHHKTSTIKSLELLLDTSHTLLNYGAKNEHHNIGFVATEYLKMFGNIVGCCTHINMASKSPKDSEHQQLAAFFLSKHTSQSVSAHNSIHELLKLA